jgi:hypothetical protein
MKYAVLQLLMTAGILAGEMSGAQARIGPEAALTRKSIAAGRSLDFFGVPGFPVAPISNPSIRLGGKPAGAVPVETGEPSKLSWPGIGTSSRRPFIFLAQSEALFQGGFEVAPDFATGGQARYLDIKTSFDRPDITGGIRGHDGKLSRSDNRVAIAGPVTRYDSRNRDTTPAAGALVQAAFDFGLQDFVARNSFLRANTAYNRHDALDDDLVLASRASLCSAAGKVPIFGLCLFGSGSDLRGYAVGRYQDKAMFAVQEELRWHVFPRLGLVVFAGVGSVTPSIGQAGKLLASGGAGLRFFASRGYGVNIGLDGAYNADGESSYYLRVGEAF